MASLFCCFGLGRRRRHFCAVVFVVRLGIPGIVAFFGLGQQLCEAGRMDWLSGGCVCVVMIVGVVLFTSKTGRRTLKSQSATGS